jgi:hypothetical protein
MKSHFFARPFYYFSIRFLRKIAIFIILGLPLTVVAQIVNIEDRRVRLSDSAHWAGFADATASLLKNDKMLTTVKLGGQIEYKNKRHFAIALTQYSLFKSGNANLQNEGFQHLRYNFDLKKQLILENFYQIKYNQRTNLKLRTLLGLGLRHKIWKTEVSRGYFGAAYMFEYDYYETQDQRFRDHRLSTYMSMSFLLSASGKSRLSFTAYFQPLFTHFGNHRLATDAGLIFQISKHFALRSNLNLSYDNDPRLNPVVPNLVYAFTNGLRYDF